MGTGDASGDGHNGAWPWRQKLQSRSPLLDETSMRGAKGLLDFDDRWPRHDAVRS